MTTSDQYAVSPVIYTNMSNSQIANNDDMGQYLVMPHEMYNSSLPDNVMNEPDFKMGPKSTDRESRNRIEKDRRTKLNNFIEELSDLISMVSDSTRKITKTGILRLAAHDLRKDYVFGNSTSLCHMDVKLSTVNTFLDLMGGFIITVTRKGIILTASSNIQYYLGHCQIDLLGQSLFSITHPQDVCVLEQNLQSSLDSREDDKDDDDTFKERREFTVRLMKACPRSEVPQYETCRIDGSLRKADKAGEHHEESLIRRQRVRRDRPIISSGNDVVFIGMVRVIKQPTVPTRLLKVSYQEYWTRHLIDGRIVQCDQAISMVAGYMADEIMGVSAFTFMHKEDVRWAIIALRQMYDQSQEFGESSYRLISRTGQFIFLKTRGFLEIDKDTKAVQSFVCVNTLVSPQDGKAMIENMKKRYSAMVNISDENKNSLYRTEPEGENLDVEDPKQLEQVIMHLVTNLPSTCSDVNYSSDSGPDSRSDVFSSPSSTHTTSSEVLNIIPPEPGTIKNAIAKSMSVLTGGKKYTRDRHLQACKRLKEECASDEESEVCKQMRHSYH